MAENYPYTMNGPAAITLILSRSLIRQLAIPIRIITTVHELVGFLFLDVSDAVSFFRRHVLLDVCQFSSQCVDGGALYRLNGLFQPDLPGRGLTAFFGRCQVELQGGGKLGHQAPLRDASEKAFLYAQVVAEFFVFLLKAVQTESNYVTTVNGGHCRLMFGWIFRG